MAIFLCTQENYCQNLGKIDRSKQMLERTQASSRERKEEKKKKLNDLKINRLLSLYLRELQFKFGKDQYRQTDTRAHTRFERGKRKDAKS